MVSRVFVIGMGMGNPNTLTAQAHDALAASELVIGAPRLLEGLGDVPVPTVPLVRSADIAQELRESDAAVASVVMSGDTGLYSGATALVPLLDGMEVEVIPGISSLSYLCARLRTTWQDVFVASAHGRACDVAGTVQTYARSFFLTGGEATVGALCAELVERGLGEVRVSVGERLSYADERISSGMARDFAGQQFDALAVMLVENDQPQAPRVHAPWLPDSAFVRGAVPMTKEEVRELAICKLRIRPSDTVWDVGAGTGSVTVEAARAAFAGRVFAVERSAEARELLRANTQAFGLTNVRVVAGTAPEALGGLPPADCVFVGGSSGSLEAILAAALGANPAVRLCMTAVTLETLAEALRCMDALGWQNVEFAQVAIAKSRVAGSHHLMEAANPVYVITADGPEAPADEGRR